MLFLRPGFPTRCYCPNANLNQVVHVQISFTVGHIDLISKEYLHGNVFNGHQ